MRPVPARSPRGRVLVVDDEPDVRALVSQRLYMAGYDPIEAGNGEDALALATAQPPQAAVIDVMMPKMNGFALTEALRADERMGAMPIVVLSARAGRADADFAVRRGADGYLVKPFRWADLAAALDAAFAKHAEAAKS
jgi:CheY-like chemotaxis protein